MRGSNSSGCVRNIFHCLLAIGHGFEKGTDLIGHLDEFGGVIVSILAGVARGYRWHNWSRAGSDQCDIEFVRKTHGGGGWRGDCSQYAVAQPCRFLHHLEAGATGDEQRVTSRHIGNGQSAECLVQSVMATDVLAHMADAAIARHMTGRMCGTGRMLQSLLPGQAAHAFV